jgi:Dolichyl-phosphate-mannose-protein mannosyltransferase
LVVSDGNVMTASDVAPTRDATGQQRRTAASAKHRAGRTLTIALVGLVAIAGSALRAEWSGAYLPWDYRWDEITNVEVGEQMAADTAVDPGFYNYPALVFLAQSAVLIPAAALTDYDPGEQSILDTQGNASAQIAEPGVLRALRWATGVIPGTVTIAAAGAIAWMISRRAWVAGLAAILVAGSAIDLRFGIIVTPDALTGMASTLAALGAVCVTLRPYRRFYLLSGAAVGLAGAAKYNGMAVAIGLVAAHLISRDRPWKDRRLLIEAAGVAAAVFAVTNVGAIVHPGELIRGVGSEAHHYSTGHFGNEGSSPIFNAGWLWRSFGLGLAAAACSLLSTSDRVRRAAIVLVAQSAGYFVLISLFPVRFARNLLPITGPLAAAAALGVFVLAQRLSTTSAGARPRLAAVALTAILAVAVVALPLRATAAAMRSLDDDPWAEAQEWVADNVLSGSKIVVENRAPVLDRDRYQIVVRQVLGSSPATNYSLTGVDYVVAVSETFEPYFDAPDEFPAVTESYRRLLAPECVVAEFEGAGQRIVIASPRDC